MNQQVSSDLIGQRQLRLEKITKLKELGIDPYPAKSFRTNSIKEVIEDFAGFENKEVILSGRIIAWRGHGKLAFADLEDQDAKIQLYMKEDTVEPKDIKGGRTLRFGELNLVDIYDFIEVYGTVTKTQRGEISILVKNLRILTKVLRPLPTSLEDKEERFRRRYVDMAVHPEIRKRMERRSLFWQAHREFLNQNGFYEVNIPILEHVPGGGDAVPFTTHMNALDEDFFLRISHELPLKRLVGAGFEKVYDIGARFRNEGLSDEHLPEHVAMEFYWAYADWQDGIKFIQDLYKYVIQQVYGDKTVFKIREFEVDFNKEWEMLDFNEIMKERYGIENIYTITIEEVKELLTKNNIEFDRSVNIARGVDALWKKIRKTIQGPAFLINHPKFLSPLQKPSLENPNMVERMQPIIAGSELGNGWSELNDPVDQYDRFIEQQKLRDAGDEEAQWLDIDYVEMLEYGIPPTFGWGHSERVFWFLEDVTAREGVPFPQLRMDFDNITREIYPEAFEIMEREEKHQSVAHDEDISGLPSIQEALKLLEDNVNDEYQKLHARMVGSALRNYAKKYNANEKLWYLTGLLHDLDYSKYPESHPLTELKWFKEWGYSKDLIHAVAAHDHETTNEKPRTKLAEAIIAVDEMSGIFYAYSVMRPEGMKGMETKSISKKFNDLKFAPRINREEIKYGMKVLGVDLNDHMELLKNTFENMKEFGGDIDYSQNLE